MKIIHKIQALHIDKPEGSAVDYFLFPEYEVHYNELKPGTIQQWHHHQQINETLFIIEGELELWWLENGAKVSRVVTAGDLIQGENTPHTFINATDKPVRMIAFRFVPDGQNKSQIIKNDKYLDEVN